MPATPFQRLVLRAVLRDVYPMVIRLVAVPDTLELTDFDDIFHAVLGWDSGIGSRVRPVLTGWVRYYGRFYPSKLQEELRTIDVFIVRWATRKYKRFQGHAMATWDWLRSVKSRNPGLFAHWSLRPMAR